MVFGIYFIEVAAPNNVPGMTHSLIMMTFSDFFPSHFWRKSPK